MVSLNNIEVFELSMTYTKCKENNAETAVEFGRQNQNLPEIFMYTCLSDVDVIKKNWFYSFKI